MDVLPVHLLQRLVPEITNEVGNGTLLISTQCVTWQQLLQLFLERQRLVAIIVTLQKLLHVCLCKKPRQQIQEHSAA